MASTPEYHVASTRHYQNSPSTRNWAINKIGTIGTDGIIILLANVIFQLCDHMTGLVTCFTV